MAYKDPEKRRAYNVAYRAARRDELNARERARYHEPGHKEKQQEYRRQNLTKYAEYQRNARARNPREALLCQAGVRARRDGLPFTISLDTLLWPTHCPILGVELDYNKTLPGHRKERGASPTLDRKINGLGYVPGNVFVISHKANRIKSNATIDELEAIARYMREHGGS